MPSRIADCLNARVQSGEIRKATAEKMEQAAIELEFAYRRDGMGPDQAAAAAVAEAARIFKEAAERKKYQTAQQIVALDRVLKEAKAHPRGIAAGAMSLLNRDIWEAGTSTANVETLTRVIEGQLQRRFMTGIGAYQSKIAGLTQDRIGTRNFVRELYGIGTGDAVAAAAAKEWQAVAKWAADRFRQAGGDLAEREDWRLPQVHDADRIHDAGFEAWRDTITPLLSEQTWTRADMLAGEDLLAKSRDEILRDVYNSIVTDLPPPPGAGRGVGGHNQHRFFVFKDAESWLKYNDRFGAGEGGIYDLLTGHLEAMARDIALVEVLGPKPNTTVKLLVEEAAKEAGAGKRRVNPLSMFEGPKAIQRTYDIVSGRTGGGRMGYAAAFLAGLRNWLTASKLGSAIVSAVPSDLATTAFAAKWNGSEMGKILSRAMNGMNEQQALRMGIVSEAVKDGGLAGKRYADEVFGRGISSRVASTVIRAQGMAAWTQRMKNAFTMEMMGHIADNVGRGYDDLDAPLRNMLRRYNISPKEWDAIRAAPLADVAGAKFFDAENVADRQLGERLMSAILQEQRFAVAEPDARVRQITTAGLPANTFMGQVARSAFQFKSFAVTMLLTHMWRAAIQAGPEKKLGYFAALAGMLTVAGAISIQARALLQGRDPRPMDSPEFWGAAMLQGGALGFFGDFLSTASGRDGGTIVTGMLGPVVGFGNDAGRLIFPNLRQLYEGEPTAAGAEAARFIRSNTPGTNLWYARAVLDRALWDQVQTMADPDYRRSFQRMERRAKKDFDQEFWWRPGQSTPSRAPDLQAALEGAK